MATKDKKEEIKEIPTRTDVIEEPSMTPTELAKSKPVDKTPPKESDSQYGKKVGDYKKIVQAAGEKGVDLDNMDKMPLMDSDKDKITEAVKGMYPKEFAQGIQNLSSAITAPQNEARNKIDQKAQMDLEKKKRRSRWADALYAFGEGLQGKTANSENFISTKIQRKQDEQFQNFKDVTERNQKTKYLWENQSRKELVDWAEEQSKNASLDAREREKFRMMADEFKEKVRHNKAMENKKTGSGDKEDKPIIVKTALKTYELKPEEAAFYKGEILKNADTLRKKYPGWFTENQSIRQDQLSGKTIYGPITYKLNPEVSETDMIRAYLENQELARGPKLNEDAYEANKASYFDKYRKEKGISTAPVSQATKPQAQKPQSKSIDNEFSKLSNQQLVEKYDEASENNKGDHVLEGGGSVSAGGGTWNLNNPEERKDFENTIIDIREFMKTGKTKSNTQQQASPIPQSAKPKADPLGLGF